MFGPDWLQRNKANEHEEMNINGSMGDADDLPVLHVNVSGDGGVPGDQILIDAAAREAKTVEEKKRRSRNRGR